MADPVDPLKSSQPPQKPTGAEPTHKEHKGSPPQFGKVTGKPMTFLGMHFTGPEAEKLWDAIIQQINTSIQHEQARALKALKKLRKSSSGRGDDD